MITIFSLFLFNNQYIFNNNLDLLGLGIVILLELLIFFPKLVSACKSGEEESDPIVNPEIDRRGSPRKSMVDVELAGEMSYDNLRGSDASPRRNNKRR